jgi:hypothetical protein
MHKITQVLAFRYVAILQLVHANFEPLLSMARIPLNLKPPLQEARGLNSQHLGSILEVYLAQIP